MTIPSTTRRAGPFYGPLTAGALIPFAFKVFAATDIAVSISDANGNETLGVLNSDYLVTLNSDQTTSPGGYVQYALGGVASSLPTGYTVAINGAREYAQDLQLTQGSNFNPVSVERGFDVLTILVQQLKDAYDRTAKITVLSPSGTDTTLPIPEASSVIGWNEDGTALRNYPPDTTFSSALLESQLASLSNAAQGDAKIGVKLTLANAQGHSLHDVHEHNRVDVFSFIPDGIDTTTTDCGPYIQNALNALAGSGKYLYGQNITMKVATRILVPTKTGLISDGSWKLVADGAGFTNVNPDVYESPTSSVVQLSGLTISPFTANEDQKVIGIKFEGNFAEGRSCNAIVARNCKNATIAFCEIYNFKHTKAIIVASLTGNSSIWGNYIHDCSSNTVFAAFPTFADRGFVNITGIDLDDDAVNSVTSDGLLVAFNRIYNLHHGATAIATYGDQADGIYQNKGNGVRFLYNRIEDTNEGLDLLGHESEVAGNYVTDCDNFGIKLIHGAKRNRVHHNTVVRSGIAGIWVGANVVVANGDTEWNEITDNVIRDIDPTNTLGASTTGCIKVESTGGGVYGRNNTFARNYCDPGTYGQYVIINNSSNDTGNVFDRNDIKAAGTLGTYLVLAANNFDITPRIKTKAQVTRSSVQAISSGAAAKVTFNSAVIDTLGEFDITTNNRWVCKHPGYYFVDFQVGIALCRGLYAHIYKNGSAVASVPGVDSATDVVQAGFARFLVYMSVADYLEGWVQHASGANRNIVAGVANTSFTVTPA